MARKKSVGEKGEGIGSCGVRGGVDMTVRMRQWKACDGTPLPLSTTLINFPTLSSTPPPCRHTEAYYMQEAVI